MILRSASSSSRVIPLYGCTSTKSLPCCRSPSLKRSSLPPFRSDRKTRRRTAQNPLISPQSGSSVDRSHHGPRYTNVLNSLSWRYLLNTNVQWRLGVLPLDWHSLTRRGGPHPPDTPPLRRGSPFEGAK